MTVGGTKHSVGEVHFQNGADGRGRIDCSGLVMCALSGTTYSQALQGIRFGVPAANLSNLLVGNLNTRNVDEWSVPGTGARGDLILFSPIPGHIGFVIDSTTFLGAQSRLGVGYARYDRGSWWGNPNNASAPVFRRPCIRDPHLPPPVLSGGGEFGGTWRVSAIWSCGSEGCGVVGWQEWFDGGGAIPLEFVVPVNLLHN
jgi:hypothetical protein